MSRVIIAGSRTFGQGISDETVVDYVGETIDDLPTDPTVIVHGDADGADTAGAKWADRAGLEIDKHEVTGKMWDRHGNKAAYYRNLGMAWHGDYLVAFWDGKSRGTAMMIRIAKDLCGEDRVFVDRYMD